MRRLALLSFSVLAGAWGLGCPSPVSPAPEVMDAGVLLDGGVTGGGGSPDGGSVPDAGEPLTDPADPEPDCARLAAGPPATAPLPTALSAAHAAVRYFGPSSAYVPVDEALAGALDDPELGEGALHRYGAALAGVCVLRAAPAALPPARAELLPGNVALLRPGAGALSVPAGASAWALDLRELPAGAAAGAALEAALRQVLASDVTRSQQEVRVHSGPTDEARPQPGAYRNFLSSTPLPAFGHSAPAAKPLAVIIGPRISPEGARAAAELRLAGRAWLFGEAIPASVAESVWAGVGTRGVGFRAMNLWRDGARWPDQLKPDRPTGELTEALVQLPSLAAPPALQLAAATRPALAVAAPATVRPASQLTRGRARAALIAAHGALRHFFPYFDVVGDRIDERLAEVLGKTGESQPPDRRQFMQLAQRLGEAIRDGHNFIWDISGETGGGGGLLAVVLDNVGNEPVVSSSRAPGFLAGDALVAVGGRPMGQWLAEELTRTSGASDGYRFDLATRRLVELDVATEFTLRAPSGATRVVTASPQPYEELEAAYTQRQRASGPLGDLGAPDLYYLNLDGFSLDGTTSTCAAALAQAKSATGLVLDMRGYPGAEGFTCLPQLLLGPAPSPNFRVMQVSVLGRLLEPATHWTMSPGPGDRFTGPLVLLVGPTTVSAAETISTLLVDAKRPKKVLGRPSAATNGNITYLSLPAGLLFTFTGMEVTHVDGSVYHGVGIVPDVVIRPTAQELATGKDTTLEAAISALRAP